MWCTSAILAVLANCRHTNRQLAVGSHWPSYAKSIRSNLRKEVKYSKAAIVAFSVLLPIIVAQLLYLQNVHLAFYNQVMLWLFSEQENYLIESYHGLTFFIMVVGFIRLNDQKGYAYLSIIILLCLSTVMLIGSFWTKSPISDSLMLSGLILILSGLLMISLHYLSYQKFGRPCQPTGIRSMNGQTSIYDMAYGMIPGGLVITSWYV